MKKQFIVLVTGFIVAGWNFTAVSEENPHQQQAQAAGTNQIQELKVKTDNLIKGKITADDNSHVYVGDTHITNTTADKVDITLDNETGAIEAKKGGVVSVGNVNMNNVKAGTVTVEQSKNRLDGKVKATDNSLISVGDVEMNNVEVTDSITINTDNHVIGSTTAEKNSTVKIGTASLNNLKGGSVDFRAKNEIQGKVKATNNSSVSVGNLSTN